MDYTELIGKKFGKLTVLGVVFKEETNKTYLKKRTYLRCKCDCGNILDVNAYSVTSGKSTSCGCNKRKSYNPDITISNFQREYNSWHGMKERCLNPKSTSYKNYGDRGITVCDRWLDPDKGFENFLLDMGDRPENTTLDRIEPLGNYVPENCRWAPSDQQGKNKSNSVRIPVGDEMLSVKECAKRLGISRSTLESRLQTLGNKPINSVLYPGRITDNYEDNANKEFTYKGETKPLKEWSVITGVEIGTLNKRIKAEWDAEKVIETPPSGRTKTRDIKHIELEFNGEIRTLGEWADFLGKDYNTIKNRYTNGLPIEKVLSSDTFVPGRNDMRGDPHDSYIGQKFGSLTITDIIRKKSAKATRIYAVVECDCGIKNKEVLLSNLTGGKQTSCGMCPRKKHLSGKKEDITNSETKIDYSTKNIIGKRFHRLVVEDYFPFVTKSGYTIYKLKCKCDCGEETIIPISNWGRVKSCGCFRVETAADKTIQKHFDEFSLFLRQSELKKMWDALPRVESKYAGQKFNKLQILDIRKHDDILYAKCRCDCGELTIKNLRNVTTGHTTSCGCGKRGPRSKNGEEYTDMCKTKICKEGDIIGVYTVERLFKQGKNIYAECLDSRTNQHKNIRACDLKKIKAELACNEEPIIVY